MGASRMEGIYKERWRRRALKMMVRGRVRVRTEVSVRVTVRDVWR